MRLCYACGQEFSTWVELREHLQKVHNFKKYVHQNERTVAIAMDSAGGITRFRRGSK